MFFDPGRPARVRPVRRGSAVPAKGTTRTPTLGLSRLNRMAFGLAVYASPRRCKTRFRLLVRLCRAGFDPQGSDEGFPICFLHLVLPSRAFHGAIPVSQFGR